MNSNFVKNSNFVDCKPFFFNLFNQLLPCVFPILLDRTENITKYCEATMFGEHYMNSSFYEILK